MDRIALVGVQESYRDVLKEALVEERAVRAVLEERLAEAHEENVALRGTLAEAEGERDVARGEAAHCGKLDRRVQDLSQAHDSMRAHCATLQVETAITQERALSKEKHCDDFEGALKLQILALKERLVSAQTSSTRDRTQLSKAVQALTHDLQQKDAAAIRLQAQLEQQEARHELKLQEASFEAAQQVQPYKMLNTKLMQQLSQLKQEHEHLRHSHTAALQRYEAADNTIGRLEVENLRLKEAQQMLWRAGRTQPPAQHAPPLPDTTTTHRTARPNQDQDQDLRRLHERLKHLDCVMPDDEDVAPQHRHTEHLPPVQTYPQPDAPTPESTHLEACGAMSLPDEELKELKDEEEEGAEGERSLSRADVETVSAASVPTEGGEGDGEEEGGHAEALDALKSSLSDVRGLLAKRAKRRQSA